MGNGASAAAEPPSSSGRQLQRDNKRGSVSVSGSIASTGLDAAELARADVERIFEAVPTLRESKLGELARAHDEHSSKEGSGEWRMPTTSTIKLVEAIAAQQMTAEGDTKVQMPDIVGFFERNGYSRDVGGRFFTALDFTHTGSLSMAEVQRLDWRAFIKDPDVTRAKEPNAQAKAAKAAYEVALKLQRGFKPYWEAGRKFLEPEACKRQGVPKPPFTMTAEEHHGAGWNFLPHIAGWLRYFLIAGNVTVRDTRARGSAALRLNEATTSEESMRHVLKAETLELMGAVLGVPPMSVLGGFRALLAEADNGHEGGAGKDAPTREEYMRDCSSAIVTVVVGVLVEYKQAIVDGKSGKHLVPDWALHAVKALVGTRPIAFTLAHAQLMQEVSRAALTVIADDGEANVYERLQLGAKLGALGADAAVSTAAAAAAVSVTPPVRLDDDDVLGNVGLVLQPPSTSDGAGNRQELRKMALESGLTEEVYAILVVQFLNVAADVIFQPVAAEIAAATDGQHAAAAPKGFARMHVKAHGDYKDEPKPTVCANLDGARCGITYQSAEAFAKGYEAMVAHPQLTPKRVKNNFRPDFDARTKTFGYRCVLCNLLLRDDTRTWGEVFREAETVLDDAAERLADTYGDAFELDALSVLSFLRSNAGFLSQPFAYLVEVQLLLSDYMDMRKKSHLLYKLVRADCSESLTPLQEDFLKEAVLWTFPE